MSRRPTASIVANPVLVGAVTVLVVMVAVFLAYNANNGLPFVPTYTLHATVPDAAELVPGNDVRVGGALVGRVQEVRAGLSNDQPVATLTMKIDNSLRPLPADTRLLIRQRSNIGLKYVELRPGRERATIPDGGELALRNASPTVDLQDVLGTFDAPTRDALGTVISELGGGLAGRGASLNQAFEAFPSVTRGLIVVGRTLARPRSDLRGFVDGLNSAATAVAPVADQLREAFGTGATTFQAFDQDALGQAIDRSPAAEQQATAGLTALAPLLRQATALARDATPGVARLGPASRQLAVALRASGPSLGRARRLAAPVQGFVAQTRRLARRHDTTGALQRLTDVVNIATPFLEFLNPFQTKCNSLGLWTRNVPSVGSEGDQMGTWFRFAPINNPSELLPHSFKSDNLHYVPLPDMGAGGECEAGNETYVDGTQIGPVPGRQPDATESTPPGSLAEKVLAEGDG